MCCPCSVCPLQVGLDEAAALQRMSAATPALLRWLGTYLNPQPGPAALLDVGYGAGGPPQQPMCIQVLRMMTHPSSTIGMTLPYSHPCCVLNAS